MYHTLHICEVDTSKSKVDFVRTRFQKSKNVPNLSKSKRVFYFQSLSNMPSIACKYAAFQQFGLIFLIRNNFSN